MILPGMTTRLRHQRLLRDILLMAKPPLLCKEGNAFGPMPLRDEQNQTRAQLLKDSPGQPPDKSKLDQLQRDTLAKVLRLLNPAQRSALLAQPK